MKIFKIAEFTGSIPQGAEQYIGTSSVDASQITSAFGRSQEAINWVNRYGSDLLKNIAFIYNYTNDNAYGVYMSDVDRKVKTPKLQKELEQLGYVIKTTEQGLTALPKEGTQKTAEDIKNDIDNAWKRLEQMGGTALGVNIGKSIRQAKEDADKINNGKQPDQRDPDLWQWLGVIHVGSTIVHEAIHAKGNKGEGPSEQAEAAFTSWILPQINKEYKNKLDSQKKSDQFSEIIVGGKVHAQGKNWYKVAQMSYYVPQSFTTKSLGSDLSGRFPEGLQGSEGIAPWSMLSQEGQKIPIENKLGRQYMSNLPKDLDQEHDSIEQQLRKYTREDEKLDPKASMTELLSSGYDRDRAYTTLEGLLDEKRVHPLLLPLKKNASSILKTATLFGWMNNLTISDGNTIPGLGDRVMAWDDRDEDFAGAEKDIKKQPRYNPSEYDRRGIFYQFFDLKSQPETWDNYIGNLGNTSPAKRFASVSDETKKEVSKILSVLSEAKKKIGKGEFSATRFIVTEDVMAIIDKVFSDESLNVNVFSLSGQEEEQEAIYSVWISSPKTPSENIEKAEKILQEKTIDKGETDEILDEMFGVSKQKEKVVNEILELTKDICLSYEIKNIYIIGSYPRDLVLGSPLYKMEEIDFCGGEGDQNIKIGGLVAEKLGVTDVNISTKTMVLSFAYKGVNVSFGGDYNLTQIKGGLKDIGIEPNSINTNIYNRDFTMNTLIYDIMSSKIIDITGMAEADLKRKMIKTLLDPEYVCLINPLVILRALKLKLKYGFDIDPALQHAMSTNAKHLLDGKYSEGKLRRYIESVKKEGKKQAEMLFKHFGLEQLI